MKALRKALLVLLAITLAVAVASCGSQKTEGTGSDGGQKQETKKAPELPKGDGDPAILTIEGDGVAFPIKLSLSQLKALKDGYAEVDYSARNNWPTNRTFSAKGIKIGYLLDLAGITDKATTVTILGKDGYLAKFTRDQLLGKRYNFPNLKAGSKDGAKEVPALLAWESAGNGEAPVNALRNFVGQTSLTNVNTVVSVKDTQTIKVETKAVERWSQPQYEVASAGGQQQITLLHEEMDATQIYYTLDGTDPTIDSKLYNPSTSYFQPELIVPVKAPAGTTFKAMVTGYGKEPSEILSVKM